VNGERDERFHSHIETDPDRNLIYRLIMEYAWIVFGVDKQREKMGTPTSNKYLRRPRSYTWLVVLMVGTVQCVLHQVSLQIVMSSSVDPESHRVASASAYMPTRAVTSKSLTPVGNTTRQRAVFYNIFVPTGEFEEHALSIVEEQLAMKHTSRLLKNVPVYYIVIGANATENVTSLCQTSHHQHTEISHDETGTVPSMCHLLQYVPHGDEGLTLQSIYDYCIEYPEAQVTYIHNKGSFHPSERNEKFRSFLNHGILGKNGDTCQEMPVDECNVCGTRLATFPHYHMAGNMWTSTCRELIRPIEFPSKMEALLERSLFPTGINDPDIPKPTFQQYSDGDPVGRYRYSFEHCIGSHPHLRPCDIYPRKYTHGYRDLPSQETTWTAKLVTAPRFDIHTFLKISQLWGEWFCGQARLWEYAFLYNGLQPDPDHFVWKYYQDQYKGCNVPLDYRLHNDFFRAKVINMNTVDSARDV